MNDYLYEGFIDEVKGALKGGSSSAIRTDLFNGKPTKLDLSSYGVGIVYQCSTEDLLAKSGYITINYEYEVNGMKHSGVMERISRNVMEFVSYFDADNTHMLTFSESFGGTGFARIENNGICADVGEIANLKLWCVYDPNEAYFIRERIIRGSSASQYTWDCLPFSHEKARTAAKNGKLFVSNFSTNTGTCYTPTLAHFNDNGKQIEVEYSTGNGYVSYLFVNGVADHRNVYKYEHALESTGTRFEDVG